MPLPHTKSYWSALKAAEKDPALICTILEKESSSRRIGMGEPFEGGPVPS